MFGLKGSLHKNSKDKPYPGGINILAEDWSETRILIGREGIRQDKTSFTLEQMYQAFAARYQSEAWMREG